MDALETEAEYVVTQLWVFVTGLIEQARYRRGEWPKPGAFEFLVRGRN